MTPFADAVGSWLRLLVVIALIMLDGMWEELRVQRAEFMMLLRWTRDVVRYDLRWAIQEKLRLMLNRGSAAGHPR